MATEFKNEWVVLCVRSTLKIGPAWQNESSLLGTSASAGPFLPPKPMPSVNLVRKLTGQWDPQPKLTLAILCGQAYSPLYLAQAICLEADLIRILISKMVRTGGKIIVTKPAWRMSGLVSGPVGPIISLVSSRSPTTTQTDILLVSLWRRFPRRLRRLEIFFL